MGLSRCPMHVGAGRNGLGCNAAATATPVRQACLVLLGTVPLQAAYRSCSADTAWICRASRQPTWQRRRRSTLSAAAAQEEQQYDAWGEPIGPGEIGMLSKDLYTTGMPDGIEGKAGGRVRLWVTATDGCPRLVIPPVACISSPAQLACPLGALALRPYPFTLTIPPRIPPHPLPYTHPRLHAVRVHRLHRHPAQA